MSATLSNPTTDTTVGQAAPQGDAAAPSFDRETEAANLLAKAGASPDINDLRRQLDAKEAAAKSAAPAAGADGKPAAAPTRNGQGRFTKASAPAAGGGDKPPAKPADKQDDKAPAPKGDAGAELQTPEDRELFVKARHALKRDGYGDEELAALDTQQILKLGTKRAAAQAEASRRYQKDRAGDSKGQAGADRSGQAATGSDQAGDRSPAGTGRTSATGANNQPGAPADIVRGALAKLTTEEARAIQQELDAAANQAAEARVAVHHRNLTTALDAATKQFPSLKDPERQREWIAKLDELDHAGESLDDLEQLTALALDAAFITEGRSRMAELAAQARDAVDAAVGGQPDVGGRRGGQQGATQEQRESLAAEALRATGNNLERAREYMNARLA